MVRWLARRFGVIPLRMPALSPTMTMGNIGKWRKTVNEAVGPGEVLCDIETDKATVDFESVEEGFLAKIVVPEGSQEVPIGKVIGYLVEEKEELGQIDSLIPKEQSTSAPIPGPTPQKSQIYESPSVSTASLKPGVTKFITPAALFHIKSNGLDPNSISASGPDGKLLKKDVLDAIKKGTAKAAHKKAPEPKPAATAQDFVPSTSNGRRKRDFVDIPHTMMRKVIAERLTFSKTTIPHAYSSIRCNLDALLSLRKSLKENHSVSVSVNDFIVKAVSCALKKVPKVNVFWDEKEEIAKSFAGIDISVAVATEGGLITPIVKDADKKGLSQVSLEVKELAARARIGKLKPHEYQGGSFSISNLGMFGITHFSAVINPPQACILAVGAGIPRVVSDSSDQPTKATMLEATLSMDSRAVDAFVAEEFLTSFKQFIEDPTSMII